MYLDNCKWHYHRYSDRRDIKDTNNQNELGPTNKHKVGSVASSFYK